MNRRGFLKASAGAILVPSLAPWSGRAVAVEPAMDGAAAPESPADIACEVFVYGSTPSGVAAALEAARRGCRVVLACPKRHAGGMLASGLGGLDSRYGRRMHASFVSEYIGAVQAAYQRRAESGAPEWQLKAPKRGSSEPSVVEGVFDAFLASQAERIRFLRGHHLTKASVAGGRVRRVVLDAPAGDCVSIGARTFIDCTYEGDLAAAAGVPYRVGREAEEEFGESLAGIRYVDWRTGKELVLPESGAASPGIQSYCARSVFTTDRKKLVPVRKPASYDQHLMDLMPLGEDFATGRLSWRSYGKPMAGLKWELNGTINAPTSLNCPGVGWAWPEANRAQRARLERYHIEHAASFVWFLQHDARVPEKLREYWRQAGLHADEFTDNGHWPWQIYVRQGRRIEGRARVTQHNFTLDPRLGRTPKVPHPVAIGEYAIDVHPCHDRRFEIKGLQEGAIWFPKSVPTPSRPGQVPYEALLPKAIDNLLVPVALSATHIGMAVCRMEPVWMTTGQVAGLAAAEAQRLGRDVAALDPTPFPQQIGLEPDPFIDPSQIQ